MPRENSYRASPKNSGTTGSTVPADASNKANGKRLGSARCVARRSSAGTGALPRRLAEMTMGWLAKPLGRKSVLFFRSSV